MARRPALRPLQPFAALADVEEAEYNERARMVAEGAQLSWSAYPPDPPEDKGKGANGSGEVVIEMTVAPRVGSRS